MDLDDDLARPVEARAGRGEAVHPDRAAAPVDERLAAARRQARAGGGGDALARLARGAAGELAGKLGLAARGAGAGGRAGGGEEQEGQQANGGRLLQG